MLNVNQLTSQLARMPDQALQQYAQMHKNDPYTVTLALAESNRRKEMRTGAQGQQGMAPQPKVIDQNIAGMSSPLPEDVGIGALAAPNMQGMAAGGIVAFQDQGLVQDMSPDAINERYRLEQLQKIRDLFGMTGASRGYQSGFTPEEKQAGMQAPAVLSPVSPTYPDESARGFKPPAPLAQQAPPPKPDLTRNTGASALRAAARPATPELGFADRLTKAMGTNPDNDIFAQRREETTNTAKTGAEAGLAKLKTDQATDMAEMFKGREGRITKREGELEKSKDTNTGMAFLEAGLAMMQARGPGLAAIAQGAGIGVKQYASGIKDIKAAQEKLDDARDRIEELRQNQTSMNKREIRVEEKGIRDLVTQGQREALAGSEKAYGFKREDMRAAVASDVARAEGALDRQNRLETARVQANATPAQIQLINKLGGGDFQKGYEIYKQEASVPRLYESYTKMASDPFKGVDFQAKYPTFDTYLASSGMLGGKSPEILNMPNAAAGNVLPR